MAVSFAQQRRDFQRERFQLLEQIARLEQACLRREGLLHEVLLLGGEDCLGPKLVERIKAEVGPVSGSEGE